MARRRHPLLSLAIVMLLALAGTGLRPAVAQDQVELRVWDQFTSPESSDAADAIYAAFTEQNPNIKIRREVVQTQQMQQTANTAITSGTGPDVIFYDAGAGYAGVLAQAGLLMPLDDLAAQYGWKDRIAPTALEGAMIGDQLFGLPLQVDLIGMYYNKSLMDQEGFTVPTTVADLASFCTQAKDKGYTPIAFSDNPGWQAFHQFSMVTNNMLGPDATRALLYENKGNWDSPEVTQAINAYFVQLRDAGCFNDDVNALTNDDAVALFQSGQSLMYPTGSWQAGSFTPDDMPDMDIQFMSFPELEGGQGSFWVSGVGSAWYVTSTSQHQQEAGQFLDYLFSPEAAQKWVGDAGFFVPMSVDTSGLNLTPLQTFILGELDKASTGEIKLGYNIDVIAPAPFNDAMLNGFQQMLAGDKTAEQQAADLQKAWDENWKPLIEVSPVASPAP
jgi:raffinose/stachyose/melibiose transport system substrate-binding protein